MTEIQVHRSGNRFVIDASGSVFASLVNLVRGNLLAHEPSAQAETRVEFSELRSAIDKIDAQLPKRPNLPNWEALAAAETISGVDFVSVSTRVVLGVDRQFLEAVAACLERVVVRGEDRYLHTLAGAHLVEVRDMYLIVCGALGRQRHARAIAFGTSHSDL